MKEVVQVKLENEMDLILAHKRAMKLCDLTGFSLIVQTSIATAVSEIARCAIEHGEQARLILGIEVREGKKYYCAVIQDAKDFSPSCQEPYAYASRLIEHTQIIRTAREIRIVLRQQVAFSGTLTDAKVQSFTDYFHNEPPLSPYDELRRKNSLLQDLAEKLRESETDYRNLTDSLPLMMFSANNQGHITYSNKGFQQFFGTAPKELNTLTWQNLIHPEEYSSYHKSISLLFLRQIPINGQYRFKQRSTNDYFWHLISILPMKNEKDMVSGYIGFLVNVHAQRQVEQTLKDNRELKETQTQLFRNQEELQRKIIELNRSNYELEQFAHLASHDLQEPLRKLFFYADVMKQKYISIMDASGISMLNNMNLAAGRMKELINDLLSYSQLQQQQLHFERLDLNQIMEEIVRDLDMTILEKDAVISIDPMPQLEGNVMRIRQLFNNLMSNSLKYSKAGVPPHIQIGANNHNGNVVISVKDNGIGFDELYKDKIFDLFQRLHTKDKFPGTGIGLSICKRIVELHHGEIKAQSKPGEYALFEVSLPLEQPYNESLN